MILSLLAPLPLLAMALYATQSPGRRPGALPKLAEGATLAALALAIIAAVALITTGPATLMLGDGALALGFRLDTLSAVMGVLVAFVGWITTRYARSYLDGEAREGAFHGLILATVAAVMILVQAGSLLTLIAAFVAVGLTLRQLLLFYPDRAPAQRAAAKFTLVWSLGDAALIIAAGLLLAAFGTSDIAAIHAAATAGPMPIAAHIATAFLVLAALCKTAGVPLHGWLTEVMEAPTPVSALLHAGVINSGGVLLLILAPLMQASPGAMAALVMLGGISALFGALVMLTQSAVKTALAWSTVAQMGFMLLQCGLGLWALALLHIVAHSLYKAHAFLASGSAVQAVLSARRPGAVAVPNLAAVAKAFVIAIVLYGLVATGFIALAGPKSAQALALGAILVFGVAYLVAQGLADAAPTELTRRTALASALATLGYFGFQQIALLLTAGSLPTPPTPGPLEWALIVLTLVSFALIAVAQALFPLWAHHPAAAGLRVHLSNGLYLNGVLDRLIGGFRPTRSATKS